MARDAFFLDIEHSDHDRQDGGPSALQPQATEPGLPCSSESRFKAAAVHVTQHNLFRGRQPPSSLYLLRSARFKYSESAA